jgi:hypothetical protein
MIGLITYGPRRYKLTERAKLKAKQTDAQQSLIKPKMVYSILQ